MCNEWQYELYKYQQLPLNTAAGEFISLADEIETTGHSTLASG